jgi:UrcA family protein
MTFKNSLHTNWLRASFTSALLLGAMFVPSVALSAEQQMEEIHTHAERPSENIVGWSLTGAPKKEVTLQYHVAFDDLDLTSNDDIEALRKRVSVAALQACADLEKRHMNLSPKLSCTSAARRSAMLQIDRAIAQQRSGE